MVGVVSVIDPDAIHEAGHVVAALCGRLNIAGVFINERGKYCSRCVFDPARTAPLPVYAMKIAGSLAVDLQNSKTNRADDRGFGTKNEWDSDAASVEYMTLYWKNLGMTAVQIRQFSDMMDDSIRQTLEDHWATLEALANEIARLASGAPPLSASRIGEIIKSTEPTFYQAIQAQLIDFH